MTKIPIVMRDFLIYLLYSDRSTESSCSIVWLSSVMVREYCIISTITEKCTPEFSDLRRSLYPTWSLRIEITKRLECAVLFFREESDPESRCHIECIIFWFESFSRCMTLPVIAETSSSCWTLWRAIVEYIFMRFRIISDHIRFTTGSFHFWEREKLLPILFQFFLYVFPYDPWMAVCIFLETNFQCIYECFPFYRGECLHRADRLLNSVWSMRAVESIIKSMPVTRFEKTSERKDSSNRGWVYKVMWYNRQDSNLWPPPSQGGVLIQLNYGCIRVFRKEGIYPLRGMP